MGFEVKLYQGNNLDEGAMICLTHRLYVNGWTMKGVFEMFLINPHKDYQVAIGHLNGVAVAAALVNRNMVMAFCRKSLRGNGYGTRCVSKLTLAPHITAGEGIRGSLRFWRQNNIPLDGGPYKWGE
jgi:hypothetical protein